MKPIYITLIFFAIFLIFLTLMYFVDIPSPGKIVSETYTLNIK